MSNSSNDLPPRLLRTPEAARYLGLSGRTLEKHRTYGTGPVYHKLGGRIVYAIEDLNIWAARGIRRSTSDPGTDVVHPAKRVDLNTRPGSRAPIRSTDESGAERPELGRGTADRTHPGDVVTQPNRR
jgi:predicted DNA-binding transcriptional regulator AlpA